jgi:hypothetical protein
MTITYALAQRFDERGSVIEFTWCVVASHRLELRHCLADRPSVQSYILYVTSTTLIRFTVHIMCGCIWKVYKAYAASTAVCTLCAVVATASMSCFS